MPYLFKRPDSVFWWAKIYANGRPKRFSTKKKSKRAALKFALQVEQKHLNEKFDLPVPASGKFFKEAFEEYLQFVKAKHSAEHHRKQEFYLRRKFIPFLGQSRNIKHIRAVDISNYLEKRLLSGVTPSTHNRELASLKAFFKYAKGKGWIKSSPAAEVKQLKEKQKPREFYTLEECRRLLSVEDPHAIYFWLIHFVGLRPKKEAFHARWSHIDWKKKIFHVTPEQAKTGEAREVPLHDQLAEKLRNHPRHISSDFILCKPDGTPYKDHRSFTKRLCWLAGVKYRAAYSMRHSFGTILFDRGANPDKVRRWMGHKSLKTTLQYAHKIEETEHEQINLHRLEFEAAKAVL